MKTAIYIEDGVVQLVLTPESDFERNALRSFEDKPLAVRVFSGAFYDSRGGWIRQKDGNFGTNNALADRSLILRIQEPKAADAGTET